MNENISKVFETSNQQAPPLNNQHNLVNFNLKTMPNLQNSGNLLSYNNKFSNPEVDLLKQQLLFSLLSLPQIKALSSQNIQKNPLNNQNIFQKLQVGSLQNLQKLTSQLEQISLSDTNKLDRIETDAFVKDFKFSVTHGRTEENDTSTNDVVSLRSTKFQPIIEQNIQKIGCYTKQERINKIQKYKEKIRHYREAHPISKNFQGRSIVAVKKPRIKGKFVTNEEYSKHMIENSISLAQNEKVIEEKKHNPQQKRAFQIYQKQKQVEKLQENASKLIELPLIMPNNQQNSQQYTANTFLPINNQSQNSISASSQINNFRMTSQDENRAANLLNQLQLIQQFTGVNEYFKQFSQKEVQQKQKYTNQDAIQQLLSSVNQLNNQKINDLFGSYQIISQNSASIQNLLERVSENNIKKEEEIDNELT